MNIPIAMKIAVNTFVTEIQIIVLKNDIIGLSTGTIDITTAMNAGIIAIITMMMTMTVTIMPIMKICT